MLILVITWQNLGNWYRLRLLSKILFSVRNLKREKKVKTCPNCKTQNTSLWRKFKSADEVQRELEKKEGNKDREIDSSKPQFEGELGCNPCVLYWKLHGVSFIIDSGSLSRSHGWHHWAGVDGRSCYESD